MGDLSSTRCVVAESRDQSGAKTHGTVDYLREMAEEGYNPDSIGPFHLTMVPWVINACGAARDDLIVDIGSGQGHCVVSAHNAGYRNLAVVDIDCLNFDLFQQRHQIRCHQANVEKDPLPFENSTVRIILCLHLIEHLHDPHSFLAESYRVLHPDGAIALVTPDWRKQYKRFWHDPTHVHPYDHESLPRLLRMHRFKRVQTFPWGSAYGLGRLKAYRRFPRLGLIGIDLLALAWK